MIILLKLLAGVCGAGLVIIAFFLYKDEEGRLKSTLEDWWERIRSLRRGTENPHISFARFAATQAELQLSRLYGPKLFSYQVAVVSFYLSISSVLVALGLIAIAADGLLFTYDLKRLIDVYLLFIVGVVSFRQATAHLRGNVPTDWRQRFRSLALCLAVLIVMCGLVVIVANIIYGPYAYAKIAERFERSPFGKDKVFPPRVMPWEHTVMFVKPIVFCAISWAFDFLALALTRKVLRGLANASSLSAVLSAEAGSCAGIVIAAGGPFLWLKIHRDREMVGLLVFANVFDALAYGAFALIALSLLFHRVLWSAVERPLYAIARHGFLEHRVTIGVVGLALLALAVPGIKEFVNFIRTLLGRT